MRGKRYFGVVGEDFAIKFLQNKGYKIIERNFKSKSGEIDIIAKDADTLVFVEVKTRASKKFGLPEEAVNPKKLYRIKRVGEYYLLTHPASVTKLRIEVVAILLENGKLASCRLIKVD